MTSSHAKLLSSRVLCAKSILKLQPSDGQTIQTKTKTKGIRLHARFDVHPQLKQTNVGEVDLIHLKNDSFRQYILPIGLL